MAELLDRPALEHLEPLSRGQVQDGVDVCALVPPVEPLERVRVRAEQVVDRPVAQLVARLARPLLRAELAEAAQVGAPSHLRTARNQTLRHRRKRALQKANASVLFTHTHQQVESF